MSRLLFALLIAPAVAWAGQATLKWDAPADTAGITGYQVLYSTVSGTYGATSVSVVGPTANTATVPNLKAGTRYFFVARSVTADPAVFSAYSNEVSATIPPSAPAGLTVSVSGN